VELDTTGQSGLFPEIAVVLCVNGEVLTASLSLPLEVAFPLLEDGIYLFSGSVIRTKMHGQHIDEFSVVPVQCMSGKCGAQPDAWSLRDGGADSLGQVQLFRVVRGEDMKLPSPSAHLPCKRREKKMGEKVPHHTSSSKKIQTVHGCCVLLTSCATLSSPSKKRERAATQESETRDIEKDEESNIEANGSCHCFLR
jgi:hypothetical protein